MENGLKGAEFKPILNFKNPTKKSIEWYHANLKQVPSESLIFIASNQEIEYPSNSSKIDILSFKIERVPSIESVPSIINVIK